MNDRPSGPKNRRERNLRKEEHQRRTLEGWEADAGRLIRSHDRAAQRLRRANSVLTLTSVAFSLLLACMVFMTVRLEWPTWLVLLGGALGVSAAVLGVAGHLVGFGMRSSRHRTAAAGYRMIRRTIQQLKPTESLSEREIGLMVIGNLLGLIEAEAPLVAREETPPPGARGSARPV